MDHQKWPAPYTGNHITPLLLPWTWCWSPCWTAHRAAAIHKSLSKYIIKEVETHSNSHYTFFFPQRLFHTLLCTSKIEDLTASVFTWLLQYILKFYQKSCKHIQTGANKESSVDLEWVKQPWSHILALLKCTALQYLTWASRLWMHPGRMETQEGVLEWTTDEKQ